MVSLAQGVSFCRVDGAIYLLDARRDRYLMLRGDRARAFLEIGERSEQGLPITREDIEPFLSEGLLDEHGDASPIRGCDAMLACRDCPTPEHNRRTAPYADILGALLSIVVTVTASRRRSFRNIVLVRGSAAASSPLVDPIGAGRALGAFERAAMLYPKRLDCLPRSLSLRRYLAHRGIFTDLLIGIRPAPFAAHCWLQIGDHVVGDRLDIISNYHPIRLVR